jgi:hypothetical protein
VRSALPKEYEPPRVDPPRIQAPAVELPPPPKTETPSYLPPKVAMVIEEASKPFQSGQISSAKLPAQVIPIPSGSISPPLQAAVPSANSTSIGSSQPAPAEVKTGEMSAVKYAHALLIIERGTSVGMEFSLTGDETQIGRWDADNGIFPDVDLDAHDPEAKVSRRHARILANSGQYSIEDLGSTNGTFVNRGRRLIPGERQTLNDGDELIVGKTFLRFKIKK